MTKDVNLVNKYVKTGTCPFCESEISARFSIGPILVGELEHNENFDTDIVEVHQLVECPECGSKWLDVYKLSDIIEVEDTKGKGY